MVITPVVRFTSLRATPGSLRVTRSTEELHAAQCIPLMSYRSSRIETSFANSYPTGVLIALSEVYTPVGYLSRVFYAK